MNEESRNHVSELMPVAGSLVRLKTSKQIGLVESSREHFGRFEVHVVFANSPAAWVAFTELETALDLEMTVSETPRLAHHHSLGEGVLKARRVLGGSEQFLVEFWESRQSVWLPWQNLRKTESTADRFKRSKLGAEDHAERFRLRTLAHALEKWNKNTGALSTLNVDPLPHQLHLVDHILKSGNYNWMIADDVGLGKTIEVGLLLSALRQYGLRRFLLVVPAGLTQQWQEEMKTRFGIDDFEIYGRDFEIHSPESWRLHDCVIASMDRLKHESHLKKIIMAQRWDLVIFDEAHRLTRSQYGMKFSSSDRFDLATNLRANTDNLLLLTGTPHQGKDDRFTALLELLRPEWRTSIRRMKLEPGFLKDVIIRNLKADVTDLEGNFIFKGKLTKLMPVNLSDAELDFDLALRRYLQEGYDASRVGGFQSRVIGFVMTTYRKLAASSLKAILTALERRQTILIKRASEELIVDEEADIRFAGELEEKQAMLTQGQEFFAGELDMLGALIAQGNNLLVTDSKLKFFLEQLVSLVLGQESNKKVLIFTEYRSTQTYLEKALEIRFGVGKVQTIHGSKNLSERRQAIEMFEADSQFLVSTEAGGEGLNLQHECHTMVNFDLPWNPMRLVQRVGRLYRYGQKLPVIVFNVQTPQTFDTEVLAIMYERLEAVAGTMVTVSDEFERQRLIDDILGELSSTLDIENILEEALAYGIERTQERIDQALKRAREASEKQRDLLQYATSYQPGMKLNDLNIGLEHLRAFVEGIFTVLGIKFEALHRSFSWDITLTEELLETLQWKRKTWRVILKDDTRQKSSSAPPIHVLNDKSKFLMLLLERAKAPDFGGKAAILNGLDGQALFGAMLRWQNERGQFHREEFVAIRVSENGIPDINPSDFSAWLLEPKTRLEPCASQNNKVFLEVAYQALEERLRNLSNTDVFPGGRLLVNAAWVRED
jgi:superfamily II DNA or RNA helicase